jgi:ubiquinone/menaquinone biosynthesis C-methylase UbiE
LEYRNLKSIVKEEVKMQDVKRIGKESKFWNNLAPEYDSFIKKNWKVYASSLLNKISEDVGAGDTVLEVACGTGLVALKVAERGDKVYGIDISSPMIEEAKKKAQELGTKNVEFSVEDAYALPFDNNMFDIVICNNALHNMMYPQKALSAIKRVIKPGGRFIAVIVGFGEAPKFKMLYTIFKPFIKLPVFYKLNLDESAKMISEAGFSIVNKEIIKDPQDKMPLLYVLAELKG